MLVTQDNYAAAMDRLSQPKRLVYDTETTGLRRWHEDRICGYVIAVPGEEAFYFPVRHASGNLSNRQHKQIIELLSRPGIRYTGWNTKFDIEMGLKEGIPIPEKAEDVMLAAHLMNENEFNFKLKDLATKYYDETAADEERKLLSLLAESGLGKGDIASLPAHLAEPYATDDCRLTEGMRNVYKTPLKDWGLWQMWQESNQYMLATVRMEQRGLPMDVDLCLQYKAEAEREAKKAYKVLKKLAGYPINPESPKQLQAFLGLPSTAKDVLEEFMEGNPAVDAVLNHRAWSKANNTYYIPYLEDHVDRDGIIHANLNLNGTVAGRPSANDPNMQAVPRYTKIYKIKDVFIARPDSFILSADYSQAELRLGAWYANEQIMMDLLNAGGDIHQATANELGIERDPAKRINFGVFYGVGPYKLSRTLRIPLEKAQFYLDTYHDRFQNILPLYHHMQVKARMEGYIRMWSGRVRRYNTPNSEPHKALSNLIQGGVGEIMKRSILRLDEMVRGGYMHMMLQVHDQILFDIHNRNAEIVKEIGHVMTDFPQFSKCPPKVDMKAGLRWGKLEDWYTFNKGLSNGRTERKRARSGWRAVRQ